MNTDITFEKLPEAVSFLIREIQDIKETLIQQGKQTAVQETRIFDIDETAAFLNLSKATIYSKKSKNEIPFMKKGNRLYFSEAKLIEYLEEGKNTTNREIEAAANAYISQSHSTK